MFKKWYTWVELFFIGIITIFFVSFFTYKLIEFSFMNEMNSYLVSNMSLKNYLSNPEYNEKERIFSYAYSWVEKGKIYYMTNENELEKLLTKQYCDKKMIAIINGKNFQEFPSSWDYNQLQITPNDRIYTVNCMNKVKVFDYNYTRVK